MTESGDSEPQMHEKVVLLEQAIYQCSYPECMKMFKTKFALKRHLLVHSKDRNYPCPVCGKLFSLPQYMREHLYTHTREKPYLCGVAGCQRRFRQAGKLSLHRRIHPEYTVKRYKFSLNPKQPVSPALLPEEPHRSEQPSGQDPNLHPTSASSAPAPLSSQSSVKYPPLNLDSRSSSVLPSDPHLSESDHAQSLLPPLEIIESINEVKVNSPQEQEQDSWTKIHIPDSLAYYAWPMIRCLPWLTLPYKPLFRPILAPPTIHPSSLRPLSQWEEDWMPHFFPLANSRPHSVPV